MSTTQIHDNAEARRSQRKEVINVTVILTVVTIVELLLGFWMMNWPEDSFKRHFVKGVIIILMLVKAYYIVAHFMHLGHENKVMKRLIILPLLIFVWFIIAFLADGHSYLELRSKYDPYSVEMNRQLKPAGEHGHEETHGTEKQ